MIQQYREDDGMDPGLGDLAYDGTEYELDEFGERIDSGDLMEEDTAEEEVEIDAADAEPVTPVADGFGETLGGEANPSLATEAEAEADTPAAATDAATDTATDDMPEGSKSDLKQP